MAELVKTEEPAVHNIYPATPIVMLQPVGKKDLLYRRTLKYSLPNYLKDSESSQLPIWPQAWTKVEPADSAGPSMMHASSLLQSGQVNVGHHDSGISMGSPISSVQSVDRNRIPSTSQLDLDPASPPQEGAYHLATSSPNPPAVQNLQAPSQPEPSESVKTEQVTEIWNPQNSNPPQELLHRNNLLVYTLLSKRVISI